jgi:hypothetical protein
MMLEMRIEVKNINMMMIIITMMMDLLAKQRGLEMNALTIVICTAKNCQKMRLM